MLITLPIEFRSIVIYLFKNSSRTSQNDSINITRLVRTELIRNNHRPTSIYIYIIHNIEYRLFSDKYFNTKPTVEYMFGNASLKAYPVALVR
jgi:hypothetical protein